MTFAAPFDTWFPDAEFDGSYGFALDDLRAVAPIPPDDGFTAHWRRWRAEACTVAPAVRVLSSEVRGGRRISVIEHASADGIRLRAWVVEPIDTVATVGVVHGHGYGGRDAVDLRRVPADAAAIFPVARGLGALNTDIGAPEERAAHVTGGLGDPDRTVIGLCARDLWLAADALVEIAGELPLYYVGESFGGGIGALALPWDERFLGATLIVPTFGQYDERLAVPCLGSGEHQRTWARAHPDGRDLLRPFDASTAALGIGIPVRIEAALWDQYVPPQGQFAVANAIADLELAVLPAGHADYPGSEQVTADAVAGGVAHLRRAAAGQPARG